MSIFGGGGTNLIKIQKKNKIKALKDVIFLFYLFTHLPSDSSII